MSKLQSTKFSDILSFLEDCTAYCGDVCVLFLKCVDILTVRSIAVLIFLIFWLLLILPKDILKQNSDSMDSRYFDMMKFIDDVDSDKMSLNEASDHTACTH